MSYQSVLRVRSIETSRKRNGVLTAAADELPENASLSTAICRLIRQFATLPEPLLRTSTWTYTGIVTDPLARAARPRCPTMRAARPSMASISAWLSVFGSFAGAVPCPTRALSP